MTPLIGIPGRTAKGSSFRGGLDIYNDSDFYVHFADYPRAIVEAGGLPVHLAFEVDPVAMVERLDGVLLTGGGDIDPTHYGRSENDAKYIDAERDRYELALVQAAVDQHKPILGICRGHQVINVQLGGTLLGHVEPHAVFDRPAVEHVHAVTLDPDSTTGRLIGQTLEVNSLHHQAIDVVGDGVRAVGWAEDGVVEAIEGINERIIGVQWHAEKLDTRADDPLFTWLVSEAGSSAG